MAGATGGKLGTFAGVFAPAILTILGVVLFLRVGWVVGHAGFLPALAIIAAANALSLLTACSLSAVATSEPFRAGGAYYMISRVLGLEAGGTIGLTLALSQTAGAAFYALGFGEALASEFPGVDPRAAASLICLLFGALVWCGVQAAVWAQYVTMGVLAVALGGFFIGGLGHVGEAVPELLPVGWQAAFPVAFAIFFPGVTGMVAGPSMSGDLADPSRSIPRGTIAAVLTGAAIYLGVGLVLGLSAPPEALRSDTLIAARLSLWGPLVHAGIWAATLSSALGSLMTAPRTLEALALDGILPRSLGIRKGGEPRTAVVVATLAASSLVWLGGVNAVAPVIAMCFLNTFAVINLTAGFEFLLASPSFRPAMRVPWPVCLLGTLACYGAMAFIDVRAAAGAILANVTIYLLLARRSLRQNFGDIRDGLRLAVARACLLHLGGRAMRGRNWRPFLAVFLRLGEASPARNDLLDFAAWTARSGSLVSVFHVLARDPSHHAVRAEREAACRRLDGLLAARGAPAFRECLAAPSLEVGVLAAAQFHGLAGVEPNTVLLGLSRRPERVELTLALAAELRGMGKSVLLLSPGSAPPEERGRRIDVWWAGRSANGRLKLLLAHMLSRAPGWRGARIRLIRPVADERGVAHVEGQARDMLAAARVSAEVRGLACGGVCAETLRRESVGAGMVLVGLRLPEEGGLADGARAVLEQSGLACPLCFVLGAENDLPVLDAPRRRGARRGA